MYIEDLEDQEGKRQERKCKHLNEEKDDKQDVNPGGENYYCQGKSRSQYKINSKKWGKYEGVYGYRYGMDGFHRNNESKYVQCSECSSVDHLTQKARPRAAE